MRKMCRCPENLAPDGHEPLVRDAAILQGEHARRIVVRVEAERPGRAAAAQRERELSPVAPRVGSRADLRRRHDTLANSMKRVGDDLSLRFTLCGHGKMLKLAPAAAIDRKSTRLNSSH